MMPMELLTSTAKSGRDRHGPEPGDGGGTGFTSVLAAGPTDGPGSQARYPGSQHPQRFESSVDRLLAKLEISVLEAARTREKGPAPRQQQSRSRVLDLTCAS